MQLLRHLVARFRWQSRPCPSGQRHQRLRYRRLDIDHQSGALRVTAAELPELRLRFAALGVVVLLSAHAFADHLSRRLGQRVKADLRGSVTRRIASTRPTGIDDNKARARASRP